MDKKFIKKVKLSNGFEIDVVDHGDKTPFEGVGMTFVPEDLIYRYIKDGKMSKPIRIKI
jgi:hypothetical protein